MAAAALVALAGPADAQYGQYGAPPAQNIPDNNRSPSSPEGPPGPAARTEVLRAAACLVGRDAGAAGRMLATAPYLAEERQEALRSLRAAERCVRARGLATSPLLLRGALAESLYEAQFAQPASPREPPVQAAALFGPASAAARADMTGAFGLGYCLAARHGPLVRALLAAEPDSPAEGTALNAMNPAFGACVPAGTQLNIDPGSLRAIAAESLYRWSVAQRDGAASPLPAPAARR